MVDLNPFSLQHTEGCSWSHQSACGFLEQCLPPRTDEKVSRVILIPRAGSGGLFLATWDQWSLVCTSSVQAGLVTLPSIFCFSPLQGGALLGGVNALHTSFPENPLEQYQRQCELILEKLELHNLLSEELRRLERLQNQSVYQSQPQAVEAETTPGPSRNDLGEESQFRTSTQQEMNCSMRTPSPGGSPKGSSLLHPPPHLEPNRSTSRKHSGEHKDSRDDSLDWFDSMATHQVEPNNTVPVSPGPKTTGGKIALKTSNSRSQGKEKSELGQKSKLETGQLPTPGETEAPLRPDSVEGKKEKKAAAVTADEPDSVLTHHVPRKLHRLRKEKAREICGNPSRAPSQPTSLSRPPSIPVHSSERTLDTLKRKRQQSLAQAEEPELERTESPDLPVAKLAKFTFKHKAKLIRSPEDHSHMSPDTTKIAVQSPKISQHGTRNAALPVKSPEKLASASGNGSSDQLQGKAKEVSQQPPKEDGSREKREHAPEKVVIQPEFEFQSETGRLRLPCERDKKEELSCNNKSSRVHACTLAKLANFSFTSSDSKSEAPLPSESKNWGERGPSPPPTTTATMIGRERKSFQLAGSTEPFILSKKSLFTLPELEDEALDFDWDEEMKKKP